MATGRGTHAFACTSRSPLRHGGRFKSTVLSALFALVLIASGAQEGLPQADPPFTGTVYMDPDIITASDPTTFQGVTAAGRGVRTMFDRRQDAFVTLSPYLFNATFDDGLSAEIQVNPEFGSVSAAMAEAEHYGRIIGQLPTVLRAELETVWIHKGDELLGGGNNNILIHTDHAEVSEQNGFLEEELAHEGAHTSLDAAHADAPDWRAAQIRDGGYISTYARDFPDREDIAESFVPYLAVRYRSERIPASVEQSILNAIPNRLAYFDAQSFDMYPVVTGEGGGNGSDSFSLASSISGASGQASGSNAGASKESGEPDHAGNAGGASLWWSWTAPASGTVTIDTEGSDFDTVLAMYTGSSIGSLTSVASNDDAIGRQSEVSFTAQQGVVYYIAVDGYNGATGSIVLGWSQAGDPVMACDPSLVCGTAITCVDGLEYPTTCGPRNCDLPIGMCAVVAAGSDSFSLASSISGASGQVTGSNVGASKESGEPNHAGNAGGASLWWSWTAPASGTVTVDTEGSDFDTVLAVYTGSGVGALTSVASNDDAIGRQSEVSFAAQQGVVYHIAVDGYSGATGSIVLGWSQNDGSGMACIPDPSLACTAAFTCFDGLLYPTGCGPLNCDLPVGTCETEDPVTGVRNGSDSFSSASSISGASGQVTGSNAGASKESGEPNHAGNAGGASLWWSWTAPASGTVTVDTEGSDFDTVLAVYTGSSIGSLTSVASNDDAIGRQSEVSFAAQQGVVYHIAVDGYSGATGSIVLNVDLLAYRGGLGGTEIDIAQFLTGPVEEGKSPGLFAAIVDQEGIRAIATVGVRRQDSSQRLTINDLVHIGSNTKAVTATMLATLVEDGVFPQGWETAIATVFPELAGEIHSRYHPIKLFQLVRMTGGVRRDARNWGAHQDEADIVRRRYAILRDNLSGPPAGPVHIGVPGSQNCRTKRSSARLRS